MDQNFSTCGTRSMGGWTWNADGGTGRPGRARDKNALLLQIRLMAGLVLETRHIIRRFENQFFVFCPVFHEISCSQRVGQIQILRRGREFVEGLEIHHCSEFAGERFTEIKETPTRTEKAGAWWSGEEKPKKKRNRNRPVEYAGHYVERYGGNTV